MATRTAKKVTAKKATAKKATAKKATKKVVKANTIDLTDSIKKIKSTATKVNTQVIDTASDVAVDLRQNGEQLREVAVAKVKEAINTLTDKVSEVTDVVTERVNEVTEVVTETVTMENMVDTAKSINQFTLKTAEEVVEGAIVNGEKWQGITHKAVKGGLKLAAKQQDIMFDTLEVVKGQLTGSAKRFKKLFQGK